MKISLNKKKPVAGFFFLLMSIQLFTPIVSHALSTGPTQPEVQAFEPVGTSDMVDLFTGDFTYNVPLLDVDGYPINIAYHGGVTMEQEASWVGLGWTINPGVVNRAVRGVPDDFDRDTIQKDLHIKDEITKKIGLGVGAELAGLGKPVINVSAGLGATLNLSNYRGVSVDLYTSLNAEARFGPVSLGLNLGASVGSQSGAAIDYGANLGVGGSRSITNDETAGGSLNLNAGGTYSPRSGLRRNVGVNASLSFSGKNAGKGSMSTGVSVPIGLMNYTPSLANSSSSQSYSGRLKLGGEVFSLYGNVNVNGSYTKLSYGEDGSRPSYGYFNYEHAGTEGLVDFSREKDGTFNTTMNYLPQATMTYDVYSLNGQGTGGSFRPFRNDYGSVYDPYVSSPDNDAQSYALEAGLGDLFEFGGEGTITTDKIEAGPWGDYKRSFKTKEQLPHDTGTLYEKVYFKEAGELSVTNPAELAQVKGTDVLLPEEANGLPLIKAGTDTKRVSRASLITMKKASEAIIKGAGSRDSLISYESINGFQDYSTYKTNATTSIGRYSNGNERLKRKLHHVSEIVQTQKDGRKYLYGLPTVNNIQKEANFSVADPGTTNKPLVNYVKGVDDTKHNNKGLENYYSATITPTYAASYLLTAVYSADYVDVTGNGPSDDDLGSFTKFNYTRKDKDFRWRSPIERDSAQYNAGYFSDKKDDKGSYILGSREQWMMHSIETKNSIAEFYVSPRQDAQGVVNRIIDSVDGGYYNEAPYNSTLAKPGSSYKLDSIKLFNKQDRLLNGANAVPIKTVFFQYNYSLCKNLPNSVNGTSGKLTLRKIYFRYGNSGKGLINPYQFDYSSVNPDYQSVAKDRWGNYKPNDSNHNNYEFPFCDQTSNADLWAEAWSLKKIKLPSGGTIDVNYESDDYAYVQNKEAMEMVRLTGIGSTTNKSSGGNDLYFDRSSPNLYLFFKRNLSRELPGRILEDQYLKGTKILQFNIPVNLVNDIYEPIKGYAEVDTIRSATDDPTYAYIKLKKISLDGGAGDVNAVTLTALNVGRYNLPHLFYPGGDPESTDLSNVINGLRYSLQELVDVHQNPYEKLLNDGRGKSVNLSKAYVRLGCAGLAKKGGGQRVKSIYFTDNWNSMVGGADSNAVYGKTYEYKTTSADNAATISSGVASYEPMIGGDENPVRMPVFYTEQKATRFPPNDPVELFQEEPIGESFYPSPVVGYSNVTVKSIHFNQGRSSQVKDRFEFYTAKDFPVQTDHSAINTDKMKPDISFAGINIRHKATQGFSIVLNDMHGKPKSTNKSVILANGGEETINYQQFFYKTNGGKLDNNANIIVYDKTGDQMVNQLSPLGEDIDITLDSRHRKETSKNEQISANANGFLVFVIPVVIPMGYPWSINNGSEFNCAVATKVVQQYGILDEVKNYVDGTITNVKNEAYDAVTGSPILTSVNNEYNDREFTMNYPAYWGSKGMGPAYQNIGYEKGFDTMRVMNLDYYANTPLKVGEKFGIIKTDSVQMKRFRLGDEVLVSYDAITGPFGGGNTQTVVQGAGSFVGRVVDYHYFVFDGYYYYHDSHTNDGCKSYVGSGLVIQPNIPYSVPNWSTMTALLHPQLKVINSGFNNQLTDMGQTVTALGSSNFMPIVRSDLRDVISQTGTVYSRNHNLVPENAIDDDSLNVYLSGKKSKAYKPFFTLTPNTARNYVVPSNRNSGLFSSTSFFLPNWYNWNLAPLSNANCNTGPNTNMTYGHDLENMNLAGDANLGYSNSYSGEFDRGGGPILWSYGNFWTHDNYIIPKTANKLDINGNEVENLDATWHPSAVVFGHNNQLPVAMAQNAKTGEFFSEGFEDMDLLLPKTYPTNSYFLNNYSPLQRLFTNTTNYGDYFKRASTNSALSISYAESHTGNKSMLATNNVAVPLPLSLWPFGETHATRTNSNLLWFKEAVPFAIASGTEYIASVWIKPQSINTGVVTTNYITNDANFRMNVGIPNAYFTPKSDIIDGWQQYEVKFVMPVGVTNPQLMLPAGYYFDDLRMFPTVANMKSFAYNILNGRLMASLDENNFASFYEYDSEGNLIRTKKESERGIITITESRQAHPKTN